MPETPPKYLNAPRKQRSTASSRHIRPLQISADSQKAFRAIMSREEMPMNVSVTVTAITRDLLSEAMKETIAPNDFIRVISLKFANEKPCTLHIPGGHLVTGDLADAMNRDFPIPNLTEKERNRFQPGTWQQIGYREQFDYVGNEEWNVRVDRDGHIHLADYLQEYVFNE